MSNATTFELHQWTTRGNDLLTRARQLLASATDEKTRLLADEVSDKILTSDKPITLVFAGQYSAGKSSLLKALTGCEDIAIGAGITTDQTHTYDWDGITLIDTPGIHTELRPDHDEIAYKAIAEADLLVFMVTNELFDMHLAEHFRELAIERDKIHEMMLVVNKMRRSATGNSPEAQEAIREDLSRVLVPFTPDDVRVTFTDAEAALQRKTESDAEIAALLWKKSGFTQFIQALNRFVQEKGLAGRYTNALYELEHVLIQSLANESTGDPTVDAFEEVLLQRHRALLETKQHILEDAALEIRHACLQILEEENQFAEMIGTAADGENIEQRFEAAQARVEQITSELQETLARVIGEHVASFDNRQRDILDGELVRELRQRLEKLGKETLNSETLGKASSISSDFSQFLLRYSVKPGADTLQDLFKLGAYSGTQTHTFIKTVGNFFGKSFKPWEAVKWTRYAASFGRVAGAAAVILPILIQIKENRDTHKKEKELRQHRSNVRAAFNEVAKGVETHFEQQVRDFVSGNILSKMDEVTAQLEELREGQCTRSQLFQSLHDLSKETRALIRDTHSSNRNG
jgi:GTPase SAR1 family protein